MLAKLILKLFGWNIYGGIPEDIKKCVVVVAPHTSMWDFIFGRLAFWKLGLRTRFLIKKEMFVFPLGPVIKWLGGIPVDRGKRGNMVNQVAELFNRYDSFYLTITPEGTRKRVEEWKKGFYYIALKANVPVALGVLDYKKKTGGVVHIFTPSGNYDEDYKKIIKYYKGAGAKHPEKFNLTS